MNYTPNYHLPTWAMTDRIQMSDFNDMTGKLDAALTANTAAHQALTAQVAKCGNCKIWVGSYKGTGKCGKENPNRFTFPARPIFAMVFSDDGDIMTLLPNAGGTIFHTSGGGSRCSLSWNGNTASWYANTTYIYDQMNSMNRNYLVVAFYQAD